MSRLPALTGSEVLRALQRVGFRIVRTSGSPHRLVHPDDPGRAATVPVHTGKTLKLGTLHGIIKQAGFSTDEFRALL